jgi:hypothetical protein
MQILAIVIVLLFAVAQRPFVRSDCKEKPQAAMIYTIAHVALTTTKVRSQIQERLDLVAGSRLASRRRFVIR